MKNKTFKRVAAIVLAAAVIITGAVLVTSQRDEPAAPSTTVAATATTVESSPPTTDAPATTSTTEAPTTTVPETPATTEVPSETPAEVQAAIDAVSEEISELFTVVYSGDMEVIEASHLDGAARQIAEVFYQFMHFMPPAEGVSPLVPEKEGRVFVPFSESTPLGDDRYLVNGVVGLAHHELGGTVTNLLVEYRDGEVAVVDFTLDPLPTGDGAYWISDLLIDAEDIQLLEGMQLSSATPAGEAHGGWFAPPADLNWDPRWFERATDKWSVNMWVEWTAGGELFASDERVMNWTGWDMAPAFVYGENEHALGTKYYHGVDIPESDLPNEGTTVTLGTDVDGALTAWWVIVDSGSVPPNVCDDSPELCPGRELFEDAGVPSNLLSSDI